MSLFCRASWEAQNGARKFDSNNTTFQNIEILHIGCYSVHKENNVVFIGKRRVAYAFQCCGRDSRRSAYDPWLPSWEGNFMYSVSNLRNMQNVVIVENL